jgi:hypothetical protein
MKVTFAILASAGLVHALGINKEPRAPKPTSPFDGVVAAALSRLHELTAMNNPWAEITGRSPAATVTHTTSTVTTTTETGFPTPTNRPQGTGRPNICDDLCDVYYFQCMGKCTGTKSSTNCTNTCYTDTCYFGAGGGQTCGMCGYIIDNCGTAFLNVPQA